MAVVVAVVVSSLEASVVVAVAVEELLVWDLVSSRLLFLSSLVSPSDLASDLGDLTIIVNTSYYCHLDQRRKSYTKYYPKI